MAYQVGGGVLVGDEDAAKSATHARLGREPAQRLAVLLHGWEGSAASLYILSLAQRLFDHGYEVLRLNLRDHGDTYHLNRELFHSCRLPERPSCRPADPEISPNSITPGEARGDRIQEDHRTNVRLRGKIAGDGQRQRSARRVGRTAPRG